jgi:glycine/D-amino acid oxidase-like deaminating enzyme
MGQIAHRSGGRSWRLRQHSLRLWGQWRDLLAARHPPIPFRNGLLRLTADPRELERLRRLAAERRRQGLPLEIWERERLRDLTPCLPPSAIGGLHSPADGQIDPVAAMEVLRRDAALEGVETHQDHAAALHAEGAGWRVELGSGGSLEAETVVLTTGIGTESLLGDLAAEPPLEPVLGQALELELSAPAPAWNWPGAVIWEGVNLIPRPDLPGGRRIWMGATVEPGSRADPAALLALRELAGTAPGWLRQAREARRWQGIRPRPRGRPAPLLESPAPGLLLATGHYRNGVLLAPATADWVAGRIEAVVPTSP